MIVQKCSGNDSSTVKLVTEKEEREKSKSKSKRKVLGFGLKERKSGAREFCLLMIEEFFLFIVQINSCEDAPITMSACR